MVIDLYIITMVVLCMKLLFVNTTTCTCTCTCTGNSLLTTKTRTIIYSKAKEKTQSNTISKYYFWQTPNHKYVPINSMQSNFGYRSMFNNNRHNKNIFDTKQRSSFVSTTFAPTTTTTVQSRISRERSLCFSSLSSSSLVSKSLQLFIMEQKRNMISDESIISNEANTNSTTSNNDSSVDMSSSSNVLDTDSVVATTIFQKKNTAIVVVVQNQDYENLTQYLAESLQLPIVIDAWNSLSELGYNNDNDCLQTSTPTSTAAIQSIIALSIVPYSLDSIAFTDYAIGINVIDTADINSDTKKKRNKKLSSTNIDKPLIVDFLPPPSTKAGKRLIETQSSSSQQDLLQKTIMFRNKKTIQQQQQQHQQSHSNSNTTEDKFKYSNKHLDTNASGMIIYDVTAGLGRDSIIMALAPETSLDSSNSIVPQKRVHMIERNPLLHTLLQDGIRRLNLVASLSTDYPISATMPTFVNDGLTHPSNTIILAKKLSKIISLCDTPADATDVLTKLKRKLQLQEQSLVTENVSAINQDCMKVEDKHNMQQQKQQRTLQSSVDSHQPHVIYIDPMFPPRKKSALVKKDMQILHALLSNDIDISAYGNLATNPIDFTQDAQVDGDDNNNNNEIGNTPSFESNDDEENERKLLLAALDVAKLRVIVKRPVNGMPLGYSVTDDDENKQRKNNQIKKKTTIPKPSYEINGSINRWDIYNLY